MRNFHLEAGDYYHMSDMGQLLEYVGQAQELLDISTITKISRIPLFCISRTCDFAIRQADYVC